MTRAVLFTEYDHPYNFRAVISSLGLDNGLKLCLDAGDELSYRSGQKFLDRSGNGNDFFLGATSVATTDDPTVNGSPNLHTASEYFTFDGSDFFRLDDTNPSWADNLHKNNAKFSLVAFVYTTAFSGLRVFGTANLIDQIGFRYNYGTSGHFVTVFNGSGSSAALALSGIGTAATDNAWQMCGVSLDESVGAVGGFVHKNGSSATTFTSTYSSPSASAATYAMEIGAAGNGQDPSNVNTRIGALAIWEGVQLTSTDYSNIWTKMRGRYGL